MTKSKYSVSSIVVLSIFVIRLMNGTQFLNSTSVARLRPEIVWLNG